MTAKDLAKRLDGREYPLKIGAEILEEAQKDGLVILYGYSDDLAEFEGAISDDWSCYDGCTIFLNSGGLLKNECGKDDCPYYKKSIESAKSIRAIHGAKGYDWIFETDIPHEVFEIIEEDGNKFCLGIVFSIMDL